jgi:hypothetical protein
MSAKSWNKSVATYCPGVGKGKFWSAEEIRAALKEQKANDIAVARRE